MSSTYDASRPVESDAIRDTLRRNGHEVAFEDIARLGHTESWDDEGQRWVQVTWTDEGPGEPVPGA